MLDTLKGNALLAAWQSCGFVKSEWGGWDFPGNDMTSRWKLREPLVRALSWAIPDDETIEWMAATCPRILEIGAGRGYWAALLTEAGADVVAFDCAIEDGGMGENGWHQAGADRVPTLWFPVRLGGPEQAAAFPARTLFLCWPPMTDMALDCLKHYQGDSLVFVGEGEGGCCATDDFFVALGRDWELIEERDIPQWPMIHDYLSLYRRKSPPPTEG